MSKQPSNSLMDLPKVLYDKPAQSVALAVQANYERFSELADQKKQRV